MQFPIVFIVNTRIGESRMAKLSKLLSNTFASTEYKVLKTAYGGHAKVLAEQCVVDKVNHIVAVGGDGTVNEVLQAIAKTDITLGIIPAGSGNGLARHCKIPLKIEEAVALLKTGKSCSIDLGKANEVYFISNAGVGFDAWVCHTIQQTKNRGLKMYIRKVLSNYLSYKADTYDIQTETQHFVEKAFFLNVANGKEFGYGFQIAPDATLQDGMLDMILVRSINLINGMKFVWDGWQKKIRNNKNCIYIRAKKIVIKGKNLQYFQTDGDAHFCAGECRIEVMENALNIWVPADTNTL